MKCEYALSRELRHTFPDGIFDISSSLNFEKIDDETKIDANLDELDKSGKITHDSDVYSIVNTKAEKSRNEPQIIEAATGGGKVIVEIEERLLNKLDRGELMLISKRMLSKYFLCFRMFCNFMTHI